MSTEFRASSSLPDLGFTRVAGRNRTEFVFESKRMAEAVIACMRANIDFEPVGGSHLPDDPYHAFDLEELGWEGRVLIQGDDSPYLFTNRTMQGVIG